MALTSPRQLPLGPAPDTPANKKRPPHPDEGQRGGHNRKES